MGADAKIGDIPIVVDGSLPPDGWYFESEMLTSPSKGIYTRTRYFPDGRVVVEEIPKGSIIVPHLIGEF